MRDLAVAVCPVCEKAFLPSPHDIADIIHGGLECDGCCPPSHPPTRLELRRFAEVEETDWVQFAKDYLEPDPERREQVMRERVLKGLEP